MLQTGFDAPEVFEDGFRWIFSSRHSPCSAPDTALKIECTRDAVQPATLGARFAEGLPGPLEGRWAVTAAGSALLPARAGQDSPRWSPSK